MFIPTRNPRGVTNIFAWEAHFELPVKAVREELMSVGAIKDAPVNVLVAACADVFAIAVAKQDTEGMQITLDDHLLAFCDRVAQTYRRVKSDLKARK